ncbi:MAG: T9SS type A sorting domain-containing protein [Bacteroidia bacterium]
MKLKLLLIFSVTCLRFSAQTSALDSAFRLGGSAGGEDAWSFDIDPIGSPVICGSFQSQTVFDPGVGHYDFIPTNRDIFVARYDSNLVCKWAFQVGGPNDDYAYGNLCDKYGNIYVTGIFSGTNVNFNPHGYHPLTSTASSNIFLAKYDTAQKFKWAFNLNGRGGCAYAGGSGSYQASGLMFDKTGNVILNGSFSDTANFNPLGPVHNLVATNGFNPFLAKYDTAGKYIWAISISGDSTEAFSGMTLDTVGNIYVTGTFQGTVDFDPSSGVYNLKSYGICAFIAKYGPGGNFIWAKKLPSSAKNSNGDDVKYGKNFIYLSGRFYGQMNFGSGPTADSVIAPNSYSYTYILKLDLSGNHIWSFSIANAMDYHPGQLYLDKNGNIVAGGVFWGTADFDPSPLKYNLNAGSNQIYLDAYYASYTENKIFNWAFNIGGNFETMNGQVKLTSNNKLYTSGAFWGTDNFANTGPSYNLTSAGYNPSGSSYADLYFARYSVSKLGTCNPPVQVNFHSTPSSCVPGSDGTLQVTVSGGKAPYAYSWSPAPGSGQGTANVGGLSVGTHSLIITDSAGCKVSRSSTIAYANLPLISVDPNSHNCYTSNNGKIKMMVSGGLAPYTYSWSGNPSTSDSAIGLSPGTYTCFVLDSKGCKVSKASKIVQKPPLSVTVTGSSVTCHSVCNGTLSSNATGGTLPYNFIWTSGCNSQNCANVCPGLYTLTVIDSNWCKVKDTVSVLAPAPISVSFFPRSAHCGKADGFDSVSAEGGTPGYSYSWLSPNTSVYDTAMNLLPRVYTVVVMDVTNCTDTVYTTVGNIGTSIYLVSTTPGDCAGNGGTATVKAQSGTSPYTYSWNPPPNTGQGTSHATGIIGTYTCIATDATGCSSGQLAITSLVSGKDSITGKVNGSVSGKITKGWVYLLNYDTVPGRLHVIDSVAIHNGTYAMLDSAADFIVFAIADSALFPNAVRSYNLNADQWIHANINTTSCFATDTASIFVKEVNPMTGNGQLSGNITQGPGYKTKMKSRPGVLSIGSPAIGVDVNLEQYPGSIKEQVKTDQNGNYSFSHINTGSYLVWVDVPGLKMSKSYIRTFTVNEQFLNLNYQIDSTHIYPDSLLITSVTTPNLSSEQIYIMPNPFKDEITIEYNLSTYSDVEIELYSMVGRRISTFTKRNQVPGIHRSTLNLGSYGVPEGIYVLKITTQGKVFSKRIVKIN